MNKIECGIISIDGDDIATERISPPDQTRKLGLPELFFIHGLGRDMDDFRPVAHMLVDEGYHAMIFDLRGHGLSSGDVYEGSITREMNFTDVQAVLSIEVSNSRDLVLVGHSYGADLAARLSADQSIAGIVLIAPALYPDETMSTSVLEVNGNSPSVVAYRRSVHTDKDNEALAALSSSTAPVLLVACYRDTYPSQIMIESYRGVISPDRLTAVAIDAEHNLDGPGQMEFAQSMLRWLRKMPRQ